MTTDEKRVYERIRYHANIEMRRAIARRKSKGKRLWIPNDPKMRARSLLRAAVKTGKVIKPSQCQECRAEVPRHRLHGHHNDYSKPFDVHWICSTCHGVHSRK